ncbi:hypothetical protein CSUI_005748 [Cystoisospora suis]|uniref:Uncharacterized protein n=1 Tax=Cystoisospora suis TaxID=483139 RepID=A0A2C6KVZ9_9APIC|nr:hypothetical protein CSUI_005748 [Cystoisospora suis]
MDDRRMIIHIRSRRVEISMAPPCDTYTSSWRMTTTTMTTTTSSAMAPSTSPSSSSSPCGPNISRTPSSNASFLSSFIFFVSPCLRWWEVVFGAERIYFFLDRLKRRRKRRMMARVIAA